MKKRFNYYLVILIIILFAGCAVRKSPDGGPKDQDPPQVVKSYPEANSLNVENIKYFMLEFNEPVKKNTFNKAIRINPKLKTGEKIKWETDKRLKIFIDDTLRKNTTYTITVGTEAKDWHEVNLSEPFVLAFSTDSIIHTGKINGRILNQKKGDNVSLSVFDIQKINQSDTSWFGIEPDLTSTSHSDGSFKIKYLKSGQYRLLAYIDQDFSQSFTPFVDAYGIFHKDVVVTSDGDSIVNMFTQLIDPDTTKPRLTKIENTDPGELQFTFTRPVRVKKIKSVSTLSPDKNEQSLLWNEFRSRRETFNVFLFNTTSQDSLRFFIETDDGSFERDFWFNPGEKDTVVKPTLSFKVPDILFFEDSLIIKSRNPVDTNSFKNGIVLKSQNNEVPVEFFWSDFKTIKVVPEFGWKFENEYTLDINYSILNDYWRQAYKDTLISYPFMINSEDDLGGLAGRFSHSPPAPQSYFLMYNIDKKRIYKRKPVGNSIGKEFEIGHLPSGKYTMSGWFESQPDGQWNSGKFLPFSYSEALFWAPDTTRIRIRWVKEGLFINNK